MLAAYPGGPVNPPQVTRTGGWNAGDFAGRRRGYSIGRGIQTHCSFIVQNAVPGRPPRVAPVFRGQRAGAGWSLFALTCSTRPSGLRSTVAEHDVQKAHTLPFTSARTLVKGCSQSHFGHSGIVIPRILRRCAGVEADLHSGAPGRREGAPRVPGTSQP